MEYGHVNPAIKSKINWTAAVAGLVGCGSAMGLIPEDAQEPINEITLIFVGTLIPIFRTFFTVK